VKNRITLRLVGLLLLIALEVSFPSTNASADVDGWSILSAGIDYQLFHLTNPRPINIFVTRLNRNELTTTIDTAIAQGTLAGGRETITGMAARYNQAINYWGETWGNRNHVVVAINGYFFNLDNGTPWSGQIQSGWYAQRFSEYIGDAGFAWKLDRSAFIGKCVYHKPIDQFLTVLRSNEIKKITRVNSPRGTDELILYTPQYSASTGTDSSGVEILVEMKRPTLVLPEPAIAKGTVVKIRDLQGNTPIPFDHVVLSASGTVRLDLLSKIQLGDEIGISQEITDCPASPTKDWTKTYASMGGDYHFLTDGELTIPEKQEDMKFDVDVPNSRTAVAYNVNYVYFIVVDGWNQGVSEGIKVSELGIFARDTLAATDAVTLDSGSSSTMVINGLVVNNTYCNTTWKCGMKPDKEDIPSGVGQYRNQDSMNEIHSPKPPDNNLIRSIPATYEPDTEPLVGNAFMMVIVEPKIHSDLFDPDMIVVTSRATQLYLGPGSNYGILGSVGTGTPGTIKGMLYNNLGGVLAKGAYWQRAEFGNLIGWVHQDDLAWVPISWPPGWFMPMVWR